MKKFRKIFRVSTSIGYIGYDPKREIYCWDFGLQFKIRKKILHINFGLIDLHKEEKVIKRLKNN